MCNIHDRISSLQKVVISLTKKRTEIIRLLIWDAEKSCKVATLEMNRLLQYLPELLKEMEAQLSKEFLPGFTRQNTPVGVTLHVSSASCPLSVYPGLFSALATGNIAIVKVPEQGGLVHRLTRDDFAQCLPASCVQFIDGTDKNIIYPLLASGVVDLLSVADGARTRAQIDHMIREHPHPHQLRTIVQFMPREIFLVCPDADTDYVAMELSRALHYSFENNKNFGDLGTGCTLCCHSQLPLVWVHSATVEVFLEKLLRHHAPSHQAHRVEAYSSADVDGPKQSTAAQQQQLLLIDALQKGARIMNCPEGGGRVDQGGLHLHAAIVYPVNETMLLWQGNTDEHTSAKSLDLHNLSADTPLPPAAAVAAAMASPTVVAAAQPCTPLGEHTGITNTLGHIPGNSDNDETLCNPVKRSAKKCAYQSLEQDKGAECAEPTTCTSSTDSFTHTRSHTGCILSVASYTSLEEEVLPDINHSHHPFPAVGIAGAAAAVGFNMVHPQTPVGSIAAPAPALAPEVVDIGQPLRVTLFAGADVNTAPEHILHLLRTVRNAPAVQAVHIVQTKRNVCLKRDAMYASILAPVHLPVPFGPAAPSTASTSTSAATTPGIGASTPSTICDIFSVSQALAQFTVETSMSISQP